MKVGLIRIAIFFVFLVPESWLPSASGVENDQVAVMPVLTRDHFWIPLEGLHEKGLASFSLACLP